MFCYFLSSLYRNSYAELYETLQLKIGFIDTYKKVDYKETIYTILYSLKPFHFFFFNICCKKIMHDWVIFQEMKKDELKTWTLQNLIVKCNIFTQMFYEKEIHFIYCIFNFFIKHNFLFYNAQIILNGEEKLNTFSKLFFTLVL